MTFHLWTVVNRSIKAFAYHNGFSVQKYHSEKLNGKCALLKDIKFYTQEGHLEVTDQYHLLKASHPHHTLHKKDLYNAIQQFYNDNNPNLDDTARLLKYLLNQRLNDNNLYMEYKFDQRTNALANLL
ncbi:14160_t:CDS:2 [Cetraspora pellucida]|uniref:14160_t:CDS:1 n=1 Tax=Cetraspora pellucida TaxID=1433469 RepID=A0ACA9KZC4_9GLOM|nr:14160_t:CDS:2 [Cetraspora pellucida]